MKLAVVITHADYEPWRSIFTNGQVQTWVSEMSETVILAQGVKLPNWIRKADSKLWGLRWKKSTGPLIVILEIWLLRILNRFEPMAKKESIAPKIEKWEFRMPDSDFLMSKKIEAVFRAAREEEFDFLVLTTSSSYINVRALKSELHTMPTTGFAGGRVLSQNRHTFLSGSFRVFSKDVVTKISESYKERNFRMVEDMSLGNLLSQLKIPLVGISSLDIESINQLFAMDKEVILGHSHFRVKSGKLTSRNDVSLMIEIHEIVKRKK
jgi:hypothetical protein